MNLHSWLAECFVVQSNIYPGFMGKVSAITHFLLEPGCEDYSFLDQAVEDFEHGLDSILMDSVETPELDSSFDEGDTGPLSASSGFLHFLGTLLKLQNHSLLLASNVKNYGDRLGHYFCLYHRLAKCLLLS